MAGRPKGTTLKNQNESKSRHVSMVNFVCEKYKKIKLTNKRIKKGDFDAIICEAKSRFGMDKCDISIKTVQSRFRRKKLIVPHRGTESPMATVEPALLQIVIQKGKMNQPLTVQEGLQLANSMIKPASETERNVIEYLKARNQYSIDGTSTKSPGNLLGSGYWAGFRRWYGHLLVSKKGVQFGHNRSEWCKDDNFKRMYDLVYEAMHVAGVAEKLTVPEWQNKAGEKVSCESEATGEKVEYRVTHPDYILHVDEVGNNTCQRDDGHKGGQKFLVERGFQPRTSCSTSEAHWTTLGFTSGTGEPVLCGIIFAAETLTVEDRLGIDIFAQCNDDMFSNENYGPGKYFPGGPKCNFRGHQIPCYVTCSPKRSITSTILADMLKWIDDLGVFPRVPGGPTPFLLLDGHGSRLEVPFLKYINDVNHKWVVCIGVPNGTSIWQVGDSNEQNGTYKMYCGECKKMITSKRFEMGLFKMNLVRTDIIPIVNYAWQKSFANVANNLKAIADRGWGPLNRILLSHPEIISSKIDSFDSQKDGLPSQSMMDNNMDDTENIAPANNVGNKYLPIQDLNFNTGFQEMSLPVYFVRPKEINKFLKISPIPISKDPTSFHQWKLPKNSVPVLSSSMVSAT